MKILALVFFFFVNNVNTFKKKESKLKFWMNCCGKLYLNLWIACGTSEARMWLHKGVTKLRLFLLILMILIYWVIGGIICEYAKNDFFFEWLILEILRSASQCRNMLLKCHFEVFECGKYIFKWFIAIN